MVKSFRPWRDTYVRFCQYNEEEDDIQNTLSNELNAVRGWLEESMLSIHTFG